MAVDYQCFVVGSHMAVAAARTLPFPWIIGEVQRTDERLRFYLTNWSTLQGIWLAANQSVCA